MTAITKERLSTRLYLQLVVTFFKYFLLLWDPKSKISSNSWLVANQKFSKILQISKICLGLKELYIYILTERKLKVKLSMKYCLNGKQLNFHVIIMHTTNNTGVNRRLRFTDPMFQLNTPWKRQKTRGILTFSGV